MSDSRCTFECIPLAIFSLTTDRGKRVRQSPRRKSSSFPLLLPFDRHFKRDTSAKAWKCRVIADFDFSTVCGVSFRESSRVLPRARYSNATRIRFPSAGQKEKKQRTAKIMANRLVEPAYTHAHIRAYTCTRVPPGERFVRLAAADLQSAPLEGGFLRDKIPAKHEAAIRAS